MKHYLIVKCSAAGDVIHAFSALSYLRQCEPEAQIDWVVEKPLASLLMAHPSIDRVIPIDTKAWRSAPFHSLNPILAFQRTLREKEYDAVFDLQGNTKSAFVTLLARSPCKVGFGKRTAAEWTNPWVTHRQVDPPTGKNIREDYLYLLQDYFKKAPLPFDPVSFTLSEAEKQTLNHYASLPLFKGYKKVMVCPGSAWPNKRLSEEALAHLLTRYQQESTFVFVWGEKHEKQQCEALQSRFPSSLVLERLSLPLLQNMMKEMDLVIAMDSLPLHLAGTTGVATFSVFGPSLAAKYAPQGEQHHSIQGPCPYGQQFDKRCPLLRTCKTGACMHMLE